MAGLRRIVFLSFLGLFSMPSLEAHATPPLAVIAEDQPLAVSETHFYVLKHFSDNGGRYNLERSKTYIAKLDSRTSKIVDFHKLQEAEQHVAEFPGQTPSSISTNEAFNLFTYLAEENAFQTGLINDRPHEAITIEKKKDQYVLSRLVFPSREAEISVIYNASLTALIRASHKPILSDYIGPIPKPVPSDELYKILPIFETLSGETCTLNKIVKAPQPLSKWDHRETPKKYIAYVTCISPGGSVYIQAALPLALTFHPKEK